MMKLRFEDVLEYLESGEDDPQFEQFLDDHPDGPRMLEEARRLHDLIREQAEEDGDDQGPDLALKMSVAEAVPEMFGMESNPARPGAPGELFADDLPEISSKDVMVAAKLAQRVSGNVRNLGELTITAREADMLLSFEPESSRFRPILRDEPPAKDKSGTRTLYQSAPSARMRESDGKFMEFMSGRTPTGALKIRGLGVELQMPGTQEPHEAIRVQVTNTRPRIPARGLALIFMPENGPFMKLVTDSKGEVELQVPEQPGVLRIEADIPQLLNIRLNF